MSKVITGKDAKIFIAGKEVGEITDLEINVESKIKYLILDEKNNLVETSMEGRMAWTDATGNPAGTIAHAHYADASFLSCVLLPFTHHGGPFEMMFFSNDESDEEHQNQWRFHTHAEAMEEFKKVHEKYTRERGLGSEIMKELKKL